MTRSTILLALICVGTIGLSASAWGDDPSPPHRNPAFAACKKQADDQKLARGDARRAFIKNCMKTAQPAPSN